MKNIFLSLFVGVLLVGCSSTPSRYAASESEKSSESAPKPAMGMPAPPPRQNTAPEPAMGMPAPHERGSGMPDGAVGMPAPHERGSGMPDGAVGMPAPDRGSGMPPGAMGMPAMDDMACRRAGGMGAVAAALEKIHYTQDCAAYSVDAEKMNQQYRVKVDCGSAGIFGVYVTTQKLSQGCKVKSSKFAH